MALRSGSPFAFIGVKAELLRQVSPDRVNRTNEWGGAGGKVWRRSGQKGMC